MLKIIAITLIIFAAIFLFATMFYMRNLSNVRNSHVDEYQNKLANKPSKQKVV